MPVLPWRFPPQEDIPGREFAIPAEPLGDPAEGRFPVEYHVGGVPAIVPGGEIAAGLPEASHHPQPAPGFQQPVEAGELPGRVVEVFGRLGAGDEVVSAIQNRTVGVKEGVVKADPVPGLLEDPGQGRARAAAVVEPFATGSEPFEERTGQAGEKTPVTGVVGVVFVEEVAFPFFVRIREEVGEEEDGLAFRADPVAGKKWSGLRRPADRAGGIRYRVGIVVFWGNRAFYPVRYGLL
jgi:hypothetical protein